MKYVCIRAFELDNALLIAEDICADRAFYFLPTQVQLGDSHSWQSLNALNTVRSFKETVTLIEYDRA